MTSRYVRLQNFALVLIAAASASVFIAANATGNAGLALAFSAHAPSAALPKDFRAITLPNIKANQFSLVADGQTTVLQVKSHDSAGSVGINVDVDPKQSPMLGWRWKVDRTIQSADTTSKSGDDYAARLYVFFDVPIESLSFIERSKIRLARLLSGADVPTAALCYVWDNRAPVGTRHWSPYTTRVHIVTLQSGTANVNQWIEEKHDVAADFRAAFGIAAPKITGIAAGNDTDQTHESATVWFGDIGFYGK
jgi:hypothetical protein